MNKRKGGLGKGLGALLEECKDTNSCGVRDINVDKIKKSPYQPRTSIDEASLNELVQSIKENGLIEPLVVRFVDGFYELIAGHRRLMALKALNLETAPVYILDIDDKQAAQFTIVENIQRKDLNPIDLAVSLQNLILSFSLKHEECAISLGKSRVYVTNLLRLLKLDPMTIDAVQKNIIQESHARLLLTIKEDEERQKILKHIISNNLSVKELDNYLRKLCGKKLTKQPVSKQFKKQQQALSSFFNRPVKVFNNSIQIKFKDEAELKAIFQQFQLPYDDD